MSGMCHVEGVRGVERREVETVRWEGRERGGDVAGDKRGTLEEEVISEVFCVFWGGNGWGLPRKCLSSRAAHAA